jgi:hypothetical protein
MRSLFYKPVVGILFVQQAVYEKTTEAQFDFM